MQEQNAALPPEKTYYHIVWVVLDLPEVWWIYTIHRAHDVLKSRSFDDSTLDFEIHKMTGKIERIHPIDHFTKPNYRLMHEQYPMMREDTARKEACIKLAKGLRTSLQFRLDSPTLRWSMWRNSIQAHRHGALVCSLRVEEFSRRKGPADTETPYEFYIRVGGNYNRASETFPIAALNKVVAVARSFIAGL